MVGNGGSRRGRERAALRPGGIAAKAACLGWGDFDRPEPVMNSFGTAAVAAALCASLAFGAAGCTGMNRTQQGALSGTAVGALAGAAYRPLPEAAEPWGRS